MNLFEQVVNPGKKYRPIPFWSWNDLLEPEELRRQINAMHNAGIGGYFMHARGGLLTEYMGKEWFDCINVCVEEGRKLDMDIWAYDENGWPSGFGNGKVNGLGLKYQQKYLRMTELAVSDAAPDYPIAFYEPKTYRLLAVRPVEGTALCLFFEVNPYYVDTLDGNVTDKFLEVIHDRYREQIATGDWPDLAGFFTDEPQISRNGIPWSFILEESYRQEYKTELIQVLPQLFCESGDFRQTRYRFWRLITLLFLDNFMKKIYNWCEKNGCRVTGHHAGEESYAGQLTCNGAVMPHYQYYHIPGMDWLCRHIRPVTVPVQLASVCAQTGKQQILSETFAACGWNIKLEELKWIYQWQMVHGVNLLCQHLESYSLKGIRKRDYPASLFMHQPWWKDYRLFNDYVSRIGLLLAEGVIAVETLILHGQSTAWLCYDRTPAGSAQIKAYFGSFIGLSDRLDEAHVNYHYGDETMIATLGSVRNGRFFIGCQSYSLIIVPQIKNLSRPVYDRLHEFIAQGGKVLAVKNRVENNVFLVEGVSEPGIDAMLQNFVWFDSEVELTAALPGYTGIQPVVPAGTPFEQRLAFASQLGKINFTRRSFPDLGGSPAELFYFVNNDLEHGFEAELYFSGGSIERFNPADGTFSPLATATVNEQLLVRHSFSAAGDLLLIVRTTVPPVINIPDTQLRSTLPEIQLDGKYTIESMTDNVITLDYCGFSFDGVLQEDYGYVLCIQDRLLKLRRPVELAMVFEFVIEAGYDFSMDLFLVMERPEIFVIAVNGTTVVNAPCGYFHDKAFHKLNLKGKVKAGINRIELNTTFRQSEQVYRCIDAAAIFESEKNKLSYDMEIEAVYLVGQFGVRTPGGWQKLGREAERYHGDFLLTCNPQCADLSAIQRCGLPFFCGEIKLTKEFFIGANESAGRILVYDLLMANVSRIAINGHKFQPIIWKPFAITLDGILKEGSNSIEITLINSLRNMLGPHHLEEGESYQVGPFSFYNEAGVFARTWAGGNIGWNDDYCFVEFGITGIRII